MNTLLHVLAAIGAFTLLSVIGVVVLCLFSGSDDEW